MRSTCIAETISVTCKKCGEMVTGCHCECEARIAELEQELAEYRVCTDAGHEHHRRRLAERRVVELEAELKKVRHAWEVEMLANQPNGDRVSIPLGEARVTRNSNFWSVIAIVLFCALVLAIAAP